MGCILVPPGEYDRTVVFDGDAVTLTNNCLLSVTLHSSSCSNTNSNKWSKNFDERPHRMWIFHWDNLTDSAAGQSERWSTACGEIPTSGLLGTVLGGVRENPHVMPIKSAQTDRPRYSVCCSRPPLASAVMRPIIKFLYLFFIVLRYNWPLLYERTLPGNLF